MIYGNTIPGYFIFRKKNGFHIEYFKFPIKTFLFYSLPVIGKKKSLSQNWEAFYIVKKG